MKLLPKFFFLVIIFNCFISFLVGQNLVPNSSFENYSSCPSYLNELDKAIPWVKAGQTGCTPDYLNSCSPINSLVSIPTNINLNNGLSGFQYARTGNGYAGMIPFQMDSYMEYIATPLTSPLKANTCYYFEMYVNLHNQSHYATDRLGVYFSQGSLPLQYPYFVLPYVPHISNPSGQFLSDTLGWSLVAGIFNATGGEDHLTIGNFYDTLNTSTIIVTSHPLNTYFYGYSYIYIDDVSLTPLTVNLGQDTVLCFREELVLNATLNIDSINYLWQDGSTNPEYTVTESGTYWVHITTNNCSFSDTINVSFSDNIFLGNDTAICPGENLVLNTNYTNASHLWQDGSTNPTLNVNKSGTYWVQVIIGNCSYSDTIGVKYITPPQKVLKDTILCVGNELNINLNSYFTYLWYDGSTDPQKTITEEGKYWLTISNSCGFSIVDSFNISFQECPCQAYLPNAFTPNQDNMNDLFAPVIDCEKLLEYEFLVFNRWGELIFESLDEKNGWDGNYKNQPCQDGIYIWKLMYTGLENGETIKKKLTGKVSLLR